MSHGGARILLVEDEEGMVLALEDCLRSEGYLVHAERDGVSGQREALSGTYGLIVLDVMLPGRDGFQVCQNIRGKGVKTPILMLTARSTSIDTVMGLRLGADDYLTKPFDTQVLLARVLALLRRSSRETAACDDAEVLCFGEFTLDTARKMLFRKQASVALNVQEYRLLEVLIRNPDRLLSRDFLLNEAWGYDTETTTRTVDVHVARLRRKLGESSTPRHILTLRGEGYRFVK